MFTISKKVEKFTLLLFARPLVTCRHIYNSIGINVKGHFNLWNTTRSWRNAYLLKTEKCHFEIYFLVQQSNSKIVHIRIIKKDRKILWNKANNLNQRFMMQYEEQNWQMVTVLTNVNWPSSLLSHAISRSPWWTLISTWVWPSAAVEKTCDFLVGMVVFRLMSFVKTPPSVSIPSDNGVTSSNNTSVTSPANTPPYVNKFYLTKIAQMEWLKQESGE